MVRDIKRKEEMKRLKSQGLSYGKIAEIYKLSRARIHQIISGYKQKNLGYRKDILIRDNYKCQWGEVCGGKKIAHKSLVVHHIDFDNENEKASNLITLCRKCHSSFHGRFHIDEAIEQKLQHKTV